MESKAYQIKKDIETDMDTIMETKSYELSQKEVFDKVHGKETMTKVEQFKKEHDNSQGLDVMTNARLSFMDRQKTFANGWTESSLDLLESLFTECNKKSEAYADAARKSRKKHRMLSIPILIVSTAAAALGFYSAGESCDAENNDSEDVKISVAVLTSITAVLGGIASLYSFDKKNAECISAAGSFDSLAKKTQIQIYLTNSMKGPVEVVINDISSEFCNLTTTSPLL